MEKLLAAQGRTSKSNCGKTDKVLGRLPEKARHGLIVFLTGAGVSAESGIPTFRGPEGYWTIGSREYHPQKLATYGSFERMPAEVWAWYLYRRSICRAAAANPGHLALAALEDRLGERFVLVTQNVDGLHLRAGNTSERTYEIHGNVDYYRCAQECTPDRYPLGERFPDFGKQQQVALEDLPRCPACRGLGRPSVLWFDECYDEERYRYQSCRQAARQARVLISVGTSGQTNLPRQMADLAAARGAFLVDINPERNPFSDLAQRTGGEWLRGPASEGMERVLEALAPTFEPGSPSGTEA